MRLNRYISDTGHCSRREADRLIGLYQPTHPGDRSPDRIGSLMARVSIGVGPIARAPLTLAAIDGRRIA